MTLAVLPSHDTSRQVDAQFNSRKTLDAYVGRLYHKVTISSRL